MKAAKVQRKATKKLAKAITEKDMQKAMKLQMKANKLSLSSAKLQRKGLKWTKEMESTFKTYKIERDSSGQYVVTKIED